MEILIPGLILVALMVWASTRIKKNAAAAYAEEAAETDTFSLTKPEGFISPVEPPDGTRYAAYSRDFGTDEADGIRLVSAEVRDHAGSSLSEVRDQIAETTDITAEDAGQKIGEKRTLTLTASRFENGVEIKERMKLIEAEGSVLELRIAAIADTEADFSDRIELMLDTFRAN
ncbi:MAG: hypothetical protein QUS14_16490 [Pyrinomonadaceae bacterium]|nr:hypothetical protein [Pyrinomonadaceae bacterium]